jgi:hypothetical protein
MLSTKRFIAVKSEKEVCYFSIFENGIKMLSHIAIVSFKRALEFSALSLNANIHPDNIYNYNKENFFK